MSNQDLVTRMSRDANRDVNRFVEGVLRAALNWVRGLFYTKRHT